jgi:invasion protein IalB
VLRHPRGLAAALTVSLILGLSVAASAQNSGLPGGASATSERFKDWTVRCHVQPAPDAKAGAKQVHKKRDAAGPRRLCVLMQRQLTQKGQRVLTVELRPEYGGLKGALILPFGLKLAKGAVLQIDNGRLSQPFAFSTCLPAGCIVPLQLGAEAGASLRPGHQLSVLLSTLDDKQLKLTVSLAGFGPAYDRVQKLTN